MHGSRQFPPRNREKRFLSSVERGQGWSASRQPPSPTAASVRGGEYLSEQAAKEAGTKAWNGKLLCCGPLRTAPLPLLSPGPSRWLFLSSVAEVTTVYMPPTGETLATVIVLSVRLPVTFTAFPPMPLNLS